MAFAAAAAAEPFSEAEVRAILAHGPWPAPGTSDPGNAASGRREAIELGQRLFFDTRLSAEGRFSCATCHVPERNWTDNRTRGVAAAEVERNTPTLMNLRLGARFGWDGKGESLWKQSIRPMLDRRELGASAAHIGKLVRSDEQLACRYRKVFGHEASAGDDATVLENVGKVLAAFQETFETPPTPFDRFRDSLARGQPSSYSDAARRGLRTFIANCSSCHSGPNFSNGELRDNGFTAEGPFKVPTLRHLMLTAPYGHHGKVETIADAVRHYSERGSEAVKPLKLTSAQQTDLVVFLESVSTLSNPWRPEDHATCR
jgi:cytochrome c peroxidase